MSNEDVIAHLTQVKGIGTWTAQIFLMFTLRRPDILPTGDLEFRWNAEALSQTKLPKPKDMEKIAKPWSPYRTYACWYLWKSVDTKKKLRAFITETPARFALPISWVGVGAEEVSAEEESVWASVDSCLPFIHVMQ